MLRWIVALLLIMLAAAVLGFSEVVAAASLVLKVVLFLFVASVIIGLVLGWPVVVKRRKR